LRIQQATADSVHEQGTAHQLICRQPNGMHCSSKASHSSMIVITAAGECKASFIVRVSP
jgi:hypothetical protein